MNQLQQELATHETHIEILTSNLEKGAADLQSKCMYVIWKNYVYLQLHLRVQKLMFSQADDYEIQELNSWLRSEQEENRKLRLKLQNAENECERPVKFCNLLVLEHFDK